MVVGTNGNLYVLASGLWPCSGMNKLLGIAPEPVGGAPNVLLNVGLAAVLTDGGIAAYNGGLVLRTKDGPQYGVQYVGYDGMLGAGYAVSDGLGLGYAEYADATVEGSVVVATKNSCSNGLAGKLAAISTAGQVWEYNLPACVQVNAVRPTPSGGAVVHVSAAGSEALLLVNASGQQTALLPISGVPSGAELVSQAFKVDLHGNIALQRWLKYDSQHKAIQLVMHSGISGIVLGSYELGYNSVGGYGYHTFADLAMGRNTWYVPAFQCWYNSCQPAAAKLYAVKVAGLAMGYPRGAILRGSLPIKSVAWLGDSFASGEGAGDYDPSTNIPPIEENFNQCHRSSNAYARLLANDQSTRLNLVGFFACSGASTPHIIDTNQYNQQPEQTLLLNPILDMVGVMIGGNDIGFAVFAKACAVDDCSGAATDTIMAAIANDLPSRLAAAYDAIAQAVGSNTRILVVNYPQLLAPEGGCLLFTAAENNAARSVIDALNNVIAEAVAAANARAGSNGSKFRLVDLNKVDSPIKGHELCTPDPYFNEIEVDGPLNNLNVESYHPNVMGQHAIYIVMNEAILDLE